MPHQFRLSVHRSGDHPIDVIPRLEGLKISIREADRGVKLQPIVWKDADPSITLKTAQEVLGSRLVLGRKGNAVPIEWPVLLGPRSIDVVGDAFTPSANGCPILGASTYFKKIVGVVLPHELVGTHGAVVVLRHRVGSSCRLGKAGIVRNDSRIGAGTLPHCERKFRVTHLPPLGKDLDDAIRGFGPVKGRSCGALQHLYSFDGVRINVVEPRRRSASSCAHKAPESAPAIDAYSINQHNRLVALREACRPTDANASPFARGSTRWKSHESGLTPLKEVRKRTDGGFLHVFR